MLHGPNSGCLSCVITGKVTKLRVSILALRNKQDGCLLKSNMTTGNHIRLVLPCGSAGFACLNYKNKVRSNKCTVHTQSETMSTD